MAFSAHTFRGMFLALGLSALFVPQAVAQGYFLTASPDRVALCPPGSVDIVLTAGTEGPTDPLTFSTDTFAAGVGVSFSVNPLFPPGSTTMTLTVGAPVDPVASLIEVRAIAPTSETSVVVQLLAPEFPPIPSHLIAPADGASGIDRRPILTWLDEFSTTERLVEVATDPAFSSLVHSAVATESTHTVDTLLDPDTQHFWRVTSSNPCAVGTPSQVWNFTTASSSQSVSAMSPDFGDQPVGAGAGPAQVAMVINDGSVPLLLGPGELGGPDAAHFSILLDSGETELPPGGQRVLVVEFTPATEGMKSASLIIASDAGSGDVDLPLSGSGIGGPAPVVAPGGLAFGVWPVNTSFIPQRNFTVVNLGAVDLTIDDVRLEGANASQFLFPAPPDTGDLAPGEVRSIAVAFDPASNGPKSAVIAVDLTIGGMPSMAQVTLTGEGGAPLSPLGLTTDEIVRELLGLNTLPLDVDVNTDAREDAADVVTNELALP